MCMCVGVYVCIHQAVYLYVCKYTVFPLVEMTSIYVLGICFPSGTMGPYTCTVVCGFFTCPHINAVMTTLAECPVGSPESVCLCDPPSFNVPPTYSLPK